MLNEISYTNSVSDTTLSNNLSSTRMRDQLYELFHDFAFQDIPYPEQQSDSEFCSSFLEELSKPLNGLKNKERNHSIPEDYQLRKTMEQSKNTISNINSTQSRPNYEEDDDDDDFDLYISKKLKSINLDDALIEKRIFKEFQDGLRGEKLLMIRNPWREQLEKEKKEILARSKQLAEAWEDIRQSNNKLKSHYEAGEFGIHQKKDLNLHLNQAIPDEIRASQNQEIDDEEFIDSRENFCQFGGRAQRDLFGQIRKSPHLCDYCEEIRDGNYLLRNETTGLYLKTTPGHDRFEIGSKGTQLCGEWRISLGRRLGFPGYCMIENRNSRKYLIVMNANLSADEYFSKKALWTLAYEQNGFKVKNAETGLCLRVRNTKTTGQEPEKTPLSGCEEGYKLEVSPDEQTNDFLWNLHLVSRNFSCGCLFSRKFH